MNKKIDCIAADRRLKYYVMYYQYIGLTTSTLIPRAAIIR